MPPTVEIPPDEAGRNTGAVRKEQRNQGEGAAGAERYKDAPPAPDCDTLLEPSPAQVSEEIRPFETHRSL